MRTVRERERERERVFFDLIFCLFFLSLKRGKFVNEFKTMVRPSSSSQQESKSKSKELIFGEPIEIEFFYETLASLQSDFQFRVCLFFLIF